MLERSELTFSGDIPCYGFQYEDENRDVRRFALEISDEDGSVLMRKASRITITLYTLYISPVLVHIFLKSPCKIGVVIKTTIGSDINDFLIRFQ